METEKKSLERACEQMERKLTRIVVEAIENGAEIRRGFMSVQVDGVSIVRCDSAYKPSLVLKLDAPEIDALFEESKEEMLKKAEKLRAELTEIENKLKSK